MTTRRYVLAIEFEDGTAYVGDTQHPQRFVKMVRRVWPNEPPPRAWIAYDYVNFFSSTSNFEKAVQRCRAAIRNKRLRSGGAGDGNIGIYSRDIGSFSNMAFQAALRHPWEVGTPLVVEGVTSPITATWRTRYWIAKISHPLLTLIATLRYYQARRRWQRDSCNDNT
jgi:hypothetical protein